MPDSDKVGILSMRLDNVTRERLDKLAAHFAQSRSNVVRLAVLRLFQAEGLDEEGKAAA